MYHINGRNIYIFKVCNNFTNKKPHGVELSQIGSTPLELKKEAFMNAKCVKSTMPRGRANKGAGRAGRRGRFVQE